MELTHYTKDHISDEQIIECVYQVRGLTLRQDLWRHRKMLFYAYIMPNSKRWRNTKTEIKEWIFRLKEIIKKHD